MIELAEVPYTLSHPFVAPPDIPADRARALRKAFMDTMSDPEYLEEAKRLGVDTSPIDGESIVSIIERLSHSPPELLDYMKKMEAGHTSE